MFGVVIACVPSVSRSVSRSSPKQNFRAKSRVFRGCISLFPTFGATIASDGSVVSIFSEFTRVSRLFDDFQVHVTRARGR